MSGLEIFDVVAIAVVLFALAFIAFFVSVEKGKGRKILKVGVCLIFFILFSFSALEARFFTQPSFIDILFVVVPAITFCVAPPIAFFVQRENLKTKILGITALVMLLLGIAIAAFVIIMRIVLSSPPWSI